MHYTPRLTKSIIIILTMFYLNVARVFFLIRNMKYLEDCILNSPYIIIDQRKNPKLPSESSTQLSAPNHINCIAYPSVCSFSDSVIESKKNW